MDLRQYDVAIARWIAIDPITHHSQSTYAAFDNNPVFWADPSGAATGFGGAAVEWLGGGAGASKMGNTGSDPDEEESDNPVYGSDGKKKGETKEGNTGEAIIYDGDEDFENMSAADLLKSGGTSYGEARESCLDDCAQDDILTDMLDGFVLPDGTKLDSGSNFDILVMGNSSIQNARYGGSINGKHNIEEWGFDFEYTVENLRAILGIHEIGGHGLGGFTTRAEHWKVFKLTIDNAPRGTTPTLMKQQTYKYLSYYTESTGKAAPKIYYDLYINNGGKKFW